MAQSANQRSCGRRTCDSPGISSLRTFGLDSPFLVLYLTVLNTWSILHGARNCDCISAGKDQGIKVEENFRTSFHASGTLHTVDHPLDVGTGGNHDMVIQSNRKACFEVHAISGMCGLGIHGAFEREQ